VKSTHAQVSITSS